MRQRHTQTLRAKLFLRRVIEATASVALVVGALHALAVSSYAGESMSSASAAVRTFYVDPAGDDANDGLSPLVPWKTLLHPNGGGFVPGDHILFKRGATWVGKLEPSATGAAEAPISFGAFGAGPLPVITTRAGIPGATSSASWTAASPGVWTLPWDAPNQYGHHSPRRIWLDGDEVGAAQSIASIDTGTGNLARWYYDATAAMLYLASPANPAVQYSVIEFPGTAEHTLNAQRACLVFDHLDVRGSTWQCVFLGGGDNVTFSGCHIGLDAGFSGFAAAASSHVHIDGCVFDSGDRLRDAWYRHDVEDGLVVTPGCSAWDVARCTFRDWGHTCVYILALGGPIADFDFHDNYLTAPDTDYCRAIGVDATEGNSSRITVSHNLMRDFTVCNQLNASGLTFAYNVMDGYANAAHGGNSGSTAYMVATQGYAGTANHDMIIANNVFAHGDEPGLSIQRNPGDSQAHDNLIINNIFYDCGRHSVSGRDGYQIYIDNVNPVLNNTFRNNIFYGAAAKVVYNGHATSQILSLANAQTADEFNASNGASGDVIADNLEIDLQFVNPAGGDFSLAPGSMAIGRGYNLGPNLAIGLSPASSWPDAVVHVPQGAHWDPGAYVSSAATDTSAAPQSSGSSRHHGCGMGAKSAAMAVVGLVALWRSRRRLSDGG